MSGNFTQSVEKGSCKFCVRNNQQIQQLLFDTLIRWYCMSTMETNFCEVYSIIFQVKFWKNWLYLGEKRLCVAVMGSHLRAYVCALYARNMSGEPKNKIGGRQYQTKPDQQEF